MTLKDDAVFKEKLTDGLKNDIRNLVNFYLHFDGLVLPKPYKVSDDIVQKSYVS